jgi:hypothetical protein
MARFQTEDDLPMDRNAIRPCCLVSNHLICPGGIWRSAYLASSSVEELRRKRSGESVCGPFYYPEKYIPPLNVPWLCTWAGDPTLIQVLLEGFFGIKAGLNGLTIEPHLPGAWTGDQLLRARFCYRGSQWEVSIHPSAPASGDTFLRKL